MTSIIFKLSVLNTLLLTAFTTYAQDSETAAEVSKGELPTVYVTAERQVKQQLGASVITAHIEGHSCFKRFLDWVLFSIFRFL